jgi:serine/threonine protein kinase/formylglycine-generating enzyme required for sulfatase activity
MAQAEQQERLSEILGSKYQILCRLGGGGMSQVYLARHRFHGGLCAIKVLAEHLAQDASIVSRFQREARMTASLGNHPNIVPVFDIGEGNGLYFLVMQFIPGEDLASFLKRERLLELAQAANVIAQVAEALSCAESKRIVHRDLKPGNMLLDESGRIKLLDFGISRITDLSDGLTRPGESMGTPYYMSPEQIRGEVCDTRSDLYSLGVVFFELLTGHRPFEHETTIAIQIAHLNTAPPSVLVFNPELPAECDAIVQKLIAKRPEDRYQNTAELLSVLIARGASTGAGELRPSVDPTLQEVIAGTDDLALQVPISTTLSPTPTSIEAMGTIPVAANGALVDSGRTLPTEKTVQRAVPPKSGFRWVAGGIVALVLLGVGVTVLWLLRSRPATPQSPTQAATAAAVFSDGHGLMLFVPGGSFQFGAAADHTAQTISLPAFYIDETEVSNAEYRRFCETTGHPPPNTPDYAAHPDYPASNVSYEDAAAYAAWAGRRLPTEEEWEKAARGTDGRSYPWGNAPWTGDVPNRIQPVISEPLRRSPYGAYNMAGNVWEWTSASYTPGPADIAGMKRLLKGQNFSADWRTIKGGSFAPGASEEFDIAKHRGLPVDARSLWIGFRCVRSAP